MFKHIIDASRIIYDTSPVKVIVKKAVSPIEIGGMKLDLDVEGIEIQIPRWAAIKLAELGIVEAKLADEISLKDLLGVLWKESREINLTEIDPNFYYKLKRKLRNLREESMRNPAPEILDKLRRFENAARDVISCRIQKIVQAALSESLPQEFLEVMTFEERALLNEISRLINEWRRHILEV